MMHTCTVLTNICLVFAKLKQITVILPSYRPWLSKTNLPVANDVLQHHASEKQSPGCHRSGHMDRQAYETLT